MSHAMLYSYEIGLGQQIVLQNMGTDTVVTLTTSAAGQQQQASSRVQTGSWVAPPSAFRTSSGVVVRLNTEGGPQFLWVQGHQVGRMAAVPNLEAAQQLSAVVSATPAATPPMEPMQPIQPMPPLTPMVSMEPLQSIPPIAPLEPLPPLTMGNLQMSLNPMEMRMGNMAMRMGDTPQPAASQPRFCTQCGGAVQPSDRFCASCGHPLHPPG